MFERSQMSLSAHSLNTLTAVPVYTYLGGFIFPVKVLVIGLLCTIGLGCGLNFYQITTDPVELWSSPTSQARREKDYYDENFGKFFRSEQMIISIDTILAQAENTTKMNITDLGHNRAPTSASTDPDKQPAQVHYGPIFNKQVLHALIDLQLEVRNLSATTDERTIRLQDICLQPLLQSTQIVQLCL